MGEPQRGEQDSVSTDAGPVRYLAVPLRDGNETNGVFVVAGASEGDQDEIDTTIQIAALVLGAVVLGTIAGRMGRRRANFFDPSAM